MNMRPSFSWQSWDDAAVAKLRALWAEGFPASRIAKEFGHGCTRNAICGKLMRLGLVGRNRVVSSTHIPRPSWTDEEIEMLKALASEGHPYRIIAAEIGRSYDSTKRQALGIGLKRPEPAPKKSKSQSVGERAERRAAAAKMRERFKCESEIPPDGAVTFAELADHHCRWPFGDPRSDDFRYCGSDRASPDGPYCRSHRAMSLVRFEVIRAPDFYRANPKPSRFAGL